MVNLTRNRILIFLAFSLLLHGLLIFLPPRQARDSGPALPAKQGTPVEVLRLPLVREAPPEQVAPPPPQVVETPAAGSLPPAKPRTLSPPTPPAPAVAPVPRAVSSEKAPPLAPAPVAGPQEPSISQHLEFSPERDTFSALSEAAAPEPEPQQVQARVPQLGSLPSPESPAENPRIAALRKAYLDALPPLIRPYQRYPLPALRAGREGTVIVRFVLERDGRLRETGILQSSGDALLDQAAAAAIARVPHFPAFPPELPDESLPIELPVRFDRSLR